MSRIEGALFCFMAVAGVITGTVMYPSTVAVEPLRTDQAAAVPATVVAPPAGLTIDGEIVRVIDGDTLILRSSMEYRIRLLDCWAPETRTRDAEEKPRGLASKNRMEELAPAGETVRVFIPVGHTAGDSLTFSRVLGRVWRIEDGAPIEPDLSVVMVSEGWATRTKEAD
jgi:endonuclease YncB( thermonuclease family)